MVFLGGCPLNVRDIKLWVSVAIWVSVTGGFWWVWYAFEGGPEFALLLTLISLVSVSVVVGNIREWLGGLLDARNELQAIRKFGRLQRRFDRMFDQDEA